MTTTLNLLLVHSKKRTSKKVEMGKNHVGGSFLTDGKGKFHDQRILEVLTRRGLARKMKQVLWSATALVCLAAILNLGACNPLHKKKLGPIDHHKLEELTKMSINRDKRKVDVVTGVKNAVLGFVFNKLNHFIDQKTAWIDQLDKTNIAKNAAHNIVPPADPITSLSAVISGAIGEKLQAAAPLITLVTNKLGSGSSSGGHTGFNFGSLLNKGLGSSSHSGAAI